MTSYREEVPHYPIRGTTLVFDKARQEHVIVLEGVLPLPVGSEIELHHPVTKRNAGAKVEGVRLLAGVLGSAGVQVGLDCSVDEEWYQ